MNIAAPPRGALEFTRRSPEAGFTGGRKPEVIVLAEAHPVDAEPVGLHVQPGVRDRGAELRLRSARRLGFDAPAAAIARVPGGVVDPRSFVVLLQSGEYLTDAVRSPQSLRGGGYRVENRVLRRDGVEVERRPGTAVVVGAPTHANWFHWWAESLARVALVKPFLRGEVPLLVPRLSAWQEDTLALTGVPSDWLEPVDGERLLAYDELIVPSRGLGSIGESSPAALRALRTMLAGWPTGPGDRIYVSRQGARRRKIRDEAAIEEVMAAHGFAIVRAESLPVAEQISRFSSAGAIAGLHGAGLANMLWAPPGAFVLELQAERIDLGAATVYWHMSAALGHRYAVCVCPVADDSNHPDVVVDPGHLDALLGSLPLGQPGESGFASQASSSSAR